MQEPSFASLRRFWPASAGRAWGLPRATRATAPNRPRAELFSVEQLERHGPQLARSHVLAPPGGLRDRLIARLSDNERTLLAVGLRLKDTLEDSQRLAPAGEWLLDNFHLLEEQIRTAKRHLPRAYGRELPRLAGGDSAGLPRAYDIALEAVAHGDGRLDAAGLRRYVAAYQSVSALQLGELWAIPIMLRLALIENVRGVAERIAAATEARVEAREWADRMMEVAERDPKSLILVTADMARSQPAMSSSFVAELARRLQGQSRPLALPLTWIEERLAESGATIEQRVHAQTQDQAADQVAIGNCIGSLRLLAAIDWREFVESLSVVEAELRGDPLHAAMDFGTRDLYRHSVERLARRRPAAQREVAAMAVRLARAAAGRSGAAPPARDAHAGYYLVDRGVAELEMAAGLHVPAGRRLARAIREIALLPYLASIALLSGLAALGLAAVALEGGASSAASTAAAILGLAAASQLAIAFVNRAATRLARPRALPRLDFSTGIPASHRTLVVVPAMLSSTTEVEALLDALEVRFLGNRDPHLGFALLADYRDAAAETLPEDAGLAALARERVEALNRKYAGAGFVLLLRPRRWNAREGCWMGVERKRGKQAHLNALLLGGDGAEFQQVAGDTRVLEGVRYVITLDADTQLPRGTARQLAGAMAHPLNRPVFDERAQRVVSGYAILQPRMAVSLPSLARSRYARLFAADSGVDPYTRAISDVYQDLFDEGSFIGKGIYDVEAFERCLAGRFPDNRILSHDLLEGCYARCGLLSDVLLYEEYPSRYLADAQRRQRWIRGDWQVAQWTFSRVPARPAAGAPARHQPPSWLSQWKLIDNLRRSLVPPATLALLLLGWAVLPRPWAWTLAALALHFAPALLAAPVRLLSRSAHAPWKAHLLATARATRDELSAAAFTLACLPFEALQAVGAITRTLARLLVTRKHLLEWTSSGALERARARDARSDFALAWRAMGAGSAVALATGLALAFARPEALAAALPLLAAWAAAPGVAWWLGRARATNEAPLGREDTEFLHALARRTWTFFERFVGPEDHWLAPDNFQEHPAPVLARRTSPTNIGLALLSTLAAHDFGYLGGGRLLERVGHTLATLQRLEHFRGHFYNWYDTATLKPLAPLYVSSVDSGNLAAHLLTLRAGLVALAEAPLLPATLWQGLRDAALLDGDAALEAARAVEAHRTPSPGALRASLAALARRARTGPPGPGAEAFAGQCEEYLQELAHFFPRSDDAFPQAGRVPSLRELAAQGGPGAVRAAARIAEAGRLASLAGEFAAMRYDFLFDDSRQLLAIGYNVAERRRDEGFYDLLASEARTATFVAIAQDQLPQESWFALGRVVTGAGGEPALLSWSGSMFEYLMPLLVMPGYEGTLLDRTCRAAVRRQVAYGKERGVPWGMSESGYNAVDAAHNYQYRAFGVPGLGLKRGLADDVVVAPYASALALMVAPAAAVANLRRLATAGLAARHGMYEAVDYTPSRLPRGQSSVLVRSFMAHHQGMTLLALDAVLLGSPMQRRFASDPALRATMLLLQEQAPKPTALAAHQVGTFEARGRQSAPEMPMRVLHDPRGALPAVQLLSNGRYHVMVTHAGGGYSTWNDIALTRWREDGTRDPWGTFCYLRDTATGDFWSSAHQPTLARAEGYEAIFTEARVEFRRTDHGIETHTEIAVSPEDDIELRRLRVTNRSRERREIEVTTFAEVVLAPAAADVLHPAFSNLFVRTEIVPALQAVLCTRRPRSPADAPLWMFHQVAVHGVASGGTSFETDRAAFVGRGGSLAAPRALREPGALAGGEGSVLDPVVAIRQRVTLAPDETATLDMVTGVGATREACLALVAKHRDRILADRVFDFAWTHNRVTLRQINASEPDAQLYARLASRVLHAHASLRAPPAVIAQNRRGQPGLWGYAISGDLPIVLVQVADVANIELVRQMVQAHAYWRLKGLAVDLVIWNEDQAGYRQVLHEQIMGLIAAGIEAHVVDRPGGIFVRRAEQIADEDRILFQSVARVILSDRRGTLAEQVARPIAEPRAAAFEPEPFARSPAHEDAQAPAPALALANGLGGFSPDGREYVVTTNPRAGQFTPAPWVNVIANAHFGTVASESGGAYTWHENAHEFRLTPWSNDPVGDSAGEAFYVRDDSNGESWSPTPLPRPGPGPYVTRHGFGYSTWEHEQSGIASRLEVFVDAQAPVKYAVLTLANRSGRTRRLCAVGYVEWVLGDVRARTAMHVVTERDAASDVLCARNAFNAGVPERIAFFDVDDAERSVTGDRAEFLGRNGSLADPAALGHARLSNRVGAGLDPCAAIQVPFELAAGRERRIVFRLGVVAARTAAEAGIAARRLRGPSSAQAALDGVHAFWRETLDAVQVDTGDPAIDVLANGWLLYQTLSCRMWARSGSYQSGGAYGFRDQLQDAMALVHARPAILREHLLRCAGRQFLEGDVQHWWHPPSGRGVRTHCSDDFLWLPLAACRYVRITGDLAAMDEVAPFLEARALPADVDSCYDLPVRSAESASLYAHCVKAIERGLRFGAHGLPLMGTGDWNDGMNLVGAGGRGESVWLAFFLHHVLTEFAPLAARRGDDAFAARCRAEAGRLRRDIEEHAWDGGWYRRAYFDDGTPLGSADGVECRIDSISQSWAVLSGAADGERARRAMLAVDARLVRRESGLVQLLDPPFDKTSSDPGYIKGYVPGVRENGGQYTHAAIWAAMAFAEQGDAARAWEVLGMINPVNHARTAAGVARYRVEPYVMAADVYAVAPHVGRGGWTWYTGAAGWMYRLLLESLLGVRREEDRLRIRPCLPAGSEGFRLRYRHGESLYRIEVRRGAPGSRDLVEVDGVAQPDGAIPLQASGGERRVLVTLAAPPA